MPSTNNDAAAVRLPPPLVFAGCVLIGILQQAYALSIQMPLAMGWRAAAATLAAVPGLVLIGGAARLFGRTGQDPKPLKPTPEIISTGVYRHSRNPMYVGMALLQAAIGLGLSNVWILILVPPALFVVYVTAVRHEEAYLEAKFGTTYRDYRNSVRRWL